MNFRNLSITFSTFVGIGMLATWTMLFITGNMSDLQSNPIETAFLLLAEIITAVLNLFAAYGLLRRRSWGTSVELFALGMLLYCTIYSIGVFGQQDNIPAVTFFGIITLLDVTIFGFMITQSLEKPFKSIDKREAST